MRFKKRHHFSRRQFLKTLGGMALALPLLEVEAGRLWAEGGDILTPGGFPRRLIVFFHPNGTELEHWMPSPGESERDFTLGRILEPLESWRDKLLITSGIDMKTPQMGPGGPHQKGMGTLLTGQPLQEGNFIGGDGSLAGWADGASVDQVIAEHIGATTAFKSLELGIRADTGAGSEVRSRLNYAGPASPLPPENNPRMVFERLFSNFGQEVTDENLLRRRKRQSVLDGVAEQLAVVQRDLGVEDRRRLERHQQLVRELEGRLENDPVLSSECSAVLQPADEEPDSEDTMPTIARAQIDLLVMAMACDLTRVGTLQFSNAVNRIRFPFVDSLAEGHNLSHQGPSNSQATEEWILRDRWHAEQFAYLLTKLDAVQEGEGTMLDNTAVLWVNELSVGNTHLHDNMPFLLAGSAGGVFDTGRFVRYASQPHNDLLVALANAYGVDIDRFGHPDFGTGGPLGGL